METLALTELQRLGFTPAQALVIGLILFALRRMNRILGRLQVRSQAQSRERARIWKQIQDDRVAVRIAMLEHERAHHADEQPKSN